MVNQCTQIGSGTLATSVFQNNTAKAKLCQMVVECLVVLHIYFTAALCHFVQWGLRNEEMSVFDNLGHLPVEKSQQ